MAIELFKMVIQRTTLRKSSLLRTKKQCFMQLMGALTNLQLELLQTFKYQLEDRQLIEIRTLLANYFAQQATAEMDRLWEENSWSEETMEEWSQEHMGTSYK